MIKSIIKILDGWEVDFKVIMAKVIIGLAILLIFYIIGKLSKRLAYKINAKVLENHKDLQVILSKIIYYFFLLIGYYLCLQVIGLEQYFVKILAGAGIVGIIAGFALKDIASNAFSGLILFFEKPFKKGDWVQVDGHCGEVIKVGLLTTTVKNKSGQQIFISNQLIYSGTFINYSSYQKRAISIQASIHQYPDLDSLRKIIKDALKNIKNIDPSQEPSFYVKSISINGSFTLEVFFWVIFKDENTYLDAVSDSMIQIRQLSADNNIAITSTKWLSDEDNTTSSGEFGAGD